MAVIIRNFVLVVFAVFLAGFTDQDFEKLTIGNWHKTDIEKFNAYIGNDEYKLRSTFDK